MSGNIHTNIRAGVAFLRNQVHHAQSSKFLNNVVDGARPSKPMFTSANSLLKMANSLFKKANKAFMAANKPASHNVYSRPEMPATPQQRPHVSHPIPPNRAYGPQGPYGPGHHLRPPVGTAPMHGQDGRPSARPTEADGRPPAASPAGQRFSIKRMNMPALMSKLGESERKNLAYQLANHDCVITLDKLSDLDDGALVFPGKSNLPPLSRAGMKYALRKLDENGMATHPLTRQQFNPNDAKLLSSDTVKFFIESHGQSIPSDETTGSTTQQNTAQEPATPSANQTVSQPASHQTDSTLGHGGAPSSVAEENQMIQQAIDESFLEANNSADQTSASGEVTLPNLQLENLSLERLTAEDRSGLLTKLNDKCPVLYERLADDPKGVVFFDDNLLTPISYTALQNMIAHHEQRNSRAPLLHPTTRDPIDLNKVKMLTKENIAALASAVNNSSS